MTAGRASEADDAEASTAAAHANARTVTDTGGDAAMAATVAGVGRPPGSDASDLIGQTIGRYRVQARLGSGGMGVVWAALDPALDRRVAIKVLPSLSPDRRASLEVRLRREAQALARLEHPNVVAVYDVGVAAESVFIAMQLIDGTTLDAYLAREALPPPQILAMFVEACRGLAAAHAAGIVHRDVKPTNLLVDRAGRVYVSDFGLARSASDAPAETTADTSLLADELTRAGAVMGTPIYMAPEQHAGAATDPRSDQFSLCVSLWTALFGQHPFVSGRWQAEVALPAMRADRVIEPPRRARVPARVVRALRRGLRCDPAARWPSMDALAEALAPPSRTAWIAAGAGVGGMAAAVALTLVLLGQRGTAAGASPCAPDPGRFADAWSPARRAALAEAFAASGRPYQADTADRVARAFDRYRDAWVHARVEVCAATHVRREQSSELLDRRMRCLDERRGAAAALVDVLATPGDAVVVDKAVDAVAALAAPAGCTRVASDAVPLPDDPAQRAEIARLTQAVSGARAKYLAGEIVAATAAVADLQAPVTATGFAALQAALATLHGTLLLDAGKAAESEKALDAAAGFAAQARDPVLEVRAWVPLFLAVVIAQQRAADTDVMLRAASSALVRSNGEPVGARAELMRFHAMAEAQRSRYTEAIELADAALAAAIDADRDAPRYRYYQAQARVRIDAGRPADALPPLKLAVAEGEARLGPAHPSVASTLTTLGGVLRGQGDYVGAQAAYARALAIYESVYGPAGQPTVGPLNGLATLAAAQNRFDEAIPAMQRVIAITEAGQGPDAAPLGTMFQNLGAMLIEADRPAEAIPYLRRALAIRERGPGPDSVEVGWVSNNLGHALRDAGQRAEARVAQTRALTILEGAYGPTYGDVAYPLEELAELDLLDGRAASAEALARRAVAARTAGPSEPRELSVARFLLARAQYARGARGPGVALARQAAAELRALGDSDVTEIDAWLAKVDAR
ncbi:MAG: serine/threonine protein kinase [Myxococcales bacterium]|nr:serine/threonine protein kinase [Myxococcales bacterium]